MNASTETETRAPNPFLVALKQALKTGRVVSARGTRDPSAPHWVRDLATFDVSINHAKYSSRQTPAERTDETLVRGIPGVIHNGCTDTVEILTHDGRTYEKYTEAYEPKRGHIYLQYNEQFPAAIESIPVYAEIQFHVYLDSHTTDLLTSKRMHGDSFSIVAVWKQGKKEIRRTFLIEVSCGLHNSARFGNSLGERNE